MSRAVSIESERPVVTSKGSVIRTEGLHFAYPDTDDEALKRIDLAIDAREFVVIMGASGTGKSTLCHTFNGLVPKQIKGDFEGTVEVMGVPSTETNVPDMARRVGFVFQDFESQLFSTSVELEVAFCPENLCVERDELRARVVSCLEQVGLAGMEKRQPATLSGGQKQRLAIASVLSAHPQMICLDDPTTDLDPVGKTDVFNIANRLATDGLTLVMVEHETAAALHASRLVLMENGEVACDGPADQVLRKTELFHELRIMPLQIPQLFAELGYAEAQRPVLQADAEARYASDGWQVDHATYADLQRADRARAEAYGDPVIEVRDLSHAYDAGRRAVDDVSLDIRAGEFVAVLGQNGSGKTTLVKHLNGLLKATSGTVAVCGSNAARTSLLDLGNHVGYVFQNPDHQIFSDTVFDEVAFALKQRSVPSNEIAKRVSHVLSIVGLAGQEEDDPFSLTKGERQRVAVASALVLEPEVLILDEPTTGLDYFQQRRMMELVRQLNERGATIIMVTHAMWVVCEYAHRTIVMNDGRCVADGPVREVFAREEERLAEMFLEPPAVVSLSNALGATALSVDELRAMSVRSET